MQSIFKKKAGIGLMALLCSVVFVGASCGSTQQTPPTAVSIDVWRMEDSDELERIAQTYQETYSHVSFNFRSFKEDEYEEALFSAWSKGEGPDIFSVPNFEFGKYREFISPMPAAGLYKRAYEEKSFGKKTLVVEERSVQFPTPNQIRDQYVNAVASDVVYNDTVYGLPYSMDTMVMYYNRDLLAQAQVAVPPTNWLEFVNASQAITELDDEQNIVLPAAALGESENVNHFFDIVSLLMMQNGADMVTESGSVTFAREGDSGNLPGAEALGFYSSFSDLALQTYTWNEDQLNSLEAFTQGNLAFYFGYYEDLETIQRRSPNLNFSYTKVPQVDPGNPVNYAHYTIESVHIGSDAASHAWNFIRFAADQNQVASYLEETERLPALKTLVGAGQDDPDTGVFVQQALTAESWYHGDDPEAAINIFADMIDEVNKKSAEIQDIIELGASKIALTINR